MQTVMKQGQVVGEWPDLTEVHNRIDVFWSKFQASQIRNVASKAPTMQVLYKLCNRAIKLDVIDYCSLALEKAEHRIRNANVWRLKEPGQEKSFVTRHPDHMQACVDKGYIVIASGIDWVDQG